VIDEVAPDGGYIFDAGAIMQDDTNIENLRAMTQGRREYGVYSEFKDAYPYPALRDCPSFRIEANSKACRLASVPSEPGVCFSWEEKSKEIPRSPVIRDMVRRVWEQIDGLGDTFILANSV
jgi:hypothetical protein